MPLIDSSTEVSAPSPTAAQFRRFIKSRPYVPLHELRRRFELNGELDEVAPIRNPDGETVYVGLPPRESQFLADLARDGDIGLELCHDPLVPIVVGVYPLRPVSRG
ncbi:MAG TPA: hypothetical protein VK992_02420 [Candidatus Caenarcaniphilales bacterium]|nr:hypothetical protein [Candidatus Caenarcaniphilales bacterium]